MLKGLRDPILMQRKKDFEKTFRAAVDADPELKLEYGNLWDKIANSRKQLSEISNKSFALSMNRLTTPIYFSIADEVVDIAENLSLPESERNDLYVGDELDITLDALFPENFDADMSNKLLEQKINNLYEYLGADDPLVKRFTDGKRGKEAVDYVLENSKITNLKDVKELLAQGPDAVLNSDDPFIYFSLNSKERASEYSKKIRELVDVESSLFTAIRCCIIQSLWNIHSAGCNIHFAFSRWCC